jgi:glycosyltransferase involved in cell wall biosynthesis
MPGYVINMSRNILYLQNYANRGGSQKSLLLLVESLDRDRYSPFVITGSDGWFVSELRRMSIPLCILKFPRWSKPRFLGASLCAAWKVARKVREWNIALIHSNEHWLGPFAVIAAKQARIPAICHLRDDLLARKRVWEYLFPMMDGIVTVSDTVGKPLYGCRFTKEKTVTVYNGVSRQWLDGGYDPLLRGRVRTSFSFDENDIIITQVGRLCERKGQRLLITAFSRLKSDTARIGGLNLRLVFAGGENAEYKYNLESEIARMHLQESVIFLGERDDIRDILAASDIFCLASYREGLPRAIIEAMGVGLPVIASDVSGNSEIVIHGRNGLLFPPGNVDELSKALLTLVTDSGLRKQMGMHGRRIVLEKFTSEVTNRKIVEVYDELLKR